MINSESPTIYEDVAGLSTFNLRRMVRMASAKANEVRDERSFLNSIFPKKPFIHGNPIIKTEEFWILYHKDPVTSDPEYTAIILNKKGTWEFGRVIYPSLELILLYVIAYLKEGDIKESTQFVKYASKML